MVDLGRLLGDHPGLADFGQRLLYLPRTDASSPVTPTVPPAEQGYQVEFGNANKVKYWRKVIGNGLAEIFGFPSVQDWHLASLPRGYCLVEKRRTGSSRFLTELFWDPSQSYVRPKDFVPHALWLCGPASEQCQCGPCQLALLTKSLSPSASASPVITSDRVELNPPGPDPAEAVRAAFSTSTFQRVWASSVSREQDLNPKKFNGDLSQALHQDEVVWLRLADVIKEDGHSLAHWPARVLEQQVLCLVRDEAHQELLAEDDIDFELEGNVEQGEWYLLHLLGVEQPTLAPRALLAPFLALQPAYDILSSASNELDTQQTFWIRHPGASPPWELASSPAAMTYSRQERHHHELRRPTLAEATPAYQLALLTLGYISRAVVPLKPLALDTGLLISESSPQDEATTPSGTHLDKHRWIVPKSAFWPRLGPLDADEGTIHNVYFQGAMVGAERIWAGDVVRLHLADEGDRERLRDELVSVVSDGARLTSTQLGLVLGMRRAVLLDVDAIMLPRRRRYGLDGAGAGEDDDKDEDGDEEDAPRLLFCGIPSVALHRLWDAELIERLGALVEPAPFDRSALPCMPHAWTRTRSSLLHNSHMPVSRDLVFVPLLDRAQEEVLALPFRLVAGRWYADAAPLQGPGADAERAEAYEHLMFQLDGVLPSSSALSSASATSSAETRTRTGGVPSSSSSATQYTAGDELSASDRDLVLHGWGPGECCAMDCGAVWDSVEGLWHEAEMTARQEVWAMLEQVRHPAAAAAAAPSMGMSTGTGTASSSQATLW